MPETSISPPVTARSSKPISEAILNEKIYVFFWNKKSIFCKICEGYADHDIQWDRCLSSLLIRSSLGLSFGVIFSFLLFKRRAWPAFVGVGFGAGRAYEECNNSFLRTHRDGPTARP